MGPKHSCGRQRGHRLGWSTEGPPEVRLWFPGRWAPRQSSQGPWLPAQRPSSGPAAFRTAGLVGSTRPHGHHPGLRWTTGGRAESPRGGTQVRVTCSGASCLINCSFPLNRTSLLTLKVTGWKVPAGDGIHGGGGQGPVFPGCGSDQDLGIQRRACRLNRAPRVM